MSSVFVSVLDLPRLAGGTYALLQLPKMPELKHCDTSSFTPHALTLNDVPYKTTPQPKQTPNNKGTYHVCMHEFSITHTLLTGQICADLVILDTTGFSCSLHDSLILLLCGNYLCNITPVVLSVVVLCIM